MGARAGVLRDSLAGVEPSWATTLLDGALGFIVDTLGAEAARNPVELVVVSDFQEGSHLAKLQGQEWPRNLRVRLLPVRANAAWKDDAITLRWLPPELEAASAEAPFKIQVHAGSGFRGDLVKLGVEGEGQRE